LDVIFKAHPSLGRIECRTMSTNINCIIEFSEDVA
jgi:hypothetical protein